MKCNVKSFIEAFVEKAKRVNAARTDGVEDCEPSFALKRKEYKHEVEEFI